MDSKGTLENTMILQLYAKTPAPRRDYYGLTITCSRVILNMWNVTYGPHVYPKQEKCSLEDMCGNKFLQDEVRHVFGIHVLNFIFSLSEGQPHLHNLPMRAFLYILKHLAANDILHLSQTSKIFFEMCNTECVWKLLFKKRFKNLSAYHRLVENGEVDWKKALKLQIFSQDFLIDNKKLKQISEIEKRNNSTIQGGGKKLPTKLPVQSPLKTKKHSTPIMNNVPNKATLSSTDLVSQMCKPAARLKSHSVANTSVNLTSSSRPPIEGSAVRR